MSLLIFVAVLLILVILIQKGRGGGLSSAFGGGGGSAAFGAKTGDVLTWFTSGLFLLFIILAVSLDLVVDGQYKPVGTANAANATTPGMVNTETNKPTEPSQTQSQSTNSQSIPAITTTLPAANNPISNAANTLTNVAVPATQSAGNSLQQMAHNAATQGAAAAKATTQPIGNVIKGLK
jgi:preprotein translocase subunit SecG